MSGRRSLVWACGLVVACCAVVTGCGQSVAEYHLNMVAMTKNEVSEQQQQQIADILTALFGTPDEPFAPAEAGLDLDKLRRCSGPVHRDAPTGSPKGLFREHCVHCHGISGDGAGPTAAFLNPYPRDYREGWYKFKSTKREERPTTANLMRTLHEGIPGTAMPSFKLLPELDRDALVEYVRYLSIRGEMELRLARMVHDAPKKGEPLKDDHDSLAAVLAPIVASWQDPVEIAVDGRPAEMQFDKIDDPAKRKAARQLSIAIGRQMFTHEAPGEFEYKPDDGGPPVKIPYQGAACIKCHGPTGLGDGQTTDYDDWTKLVWDPAAWGRKPSDPIPASLVMPLGALPERHIVPRNLRMGVYRGGRRPLDMYYRIHEGIKGVPMPATDLLTAQDKAALKKISDAADKQFRAKSPDLVIGEDDSDEVQEMKLRKKAEFIAKIVDPEMEKLQSRRLWNLIDYVMALPYEPGGELGVDADITNGGHGELVTR
ncbi:MAG TPA: cytochrome c [Pirellulales bacterium]|nr:cytochrome c [Pirellulales bacterium]